MIRRRALPASSSSPPLVASPAHAQRLYDDMIAAVNNDRAGDVKALLARGVDPDTVDPNGDPCSTSAARAGFTGPSTSCSRPRSTSTRAARFGDTPMMGAALEGHLEIVKKLRARGAALDYKGWTPLIYAATGGRDAVVAFLLDQGANVNADSPNGTTALMMAVREGKGSTVELLIKRGRRRQPPQRERRLGARLGEARQRGRDGRTFCAARARRTRGAGRRLRDRTRAAPDRRRLRRLSPR